MTTIAQRDLRNDNAENMRRVEAGESFTVTRNGRPFADLVPHGSRPRRLTLGEIQEKYRREGLNVDSEQWYADRAADDKIFGDATGLVSAISIGELALGLNVGPAEQRAERARLLRNVLMLHEVLPFDVEEAKMCGVLADLVRAVGRNSRPRRLDLQIAATAAMARLPLLTCNPDDFLGTETLVDVVSIERSRRPLPDQGRLG